MKEKKTVSHVTHFKILIHLKKFRLYCYLFSENNPIFRFGILILISIKRRTMKTIM